MPKGVCCGEKAVLVTVYVERPIRKTRRRRRAASLSDHNDQYNNNDQLHHPITLPSVHRRTGGGVRGYDRRAELLHYSQRLRESMQSVASMPLNPTTPSASHTQEPLTKAVAVQGKCRKSRVPSCLGNWKFLVPSFLRSFGGKEGKKKKKKKNKKKQYNSRSATSNINGIVRSLQVHKKWEFILKLLTTLRKQK